MERENNHPPLVEEICSFPPEKINRERDVREKFVEILHQSTNRLKQEKTTIHFPQKDLVSFFTECIHVEVKEAILIFTLVIQDDNTSSELTNWVDEFLVECLTEYDIHPFLMEVAGYCLVHRIMPKYSLIHEHKKKKEYKKELETHFNRREIISELLVKKIDLGDETRNPIIFKVLGDLGDESILPYLGDMLINKKTDFEAYWLADTISRIHHPPNKQIKPPMKKRIQNFIKSNWITYLTYFIIITFVSLFYFFNINTQLRPGISFYWLVFILLGLILIWQIVAASAILNTLMSWLMGFSVILSSLISPIAKLKLMKKKKRSNDVYAIDSLRFWHTGNNARRYEKYGYRLLKPLIYLFLLFVLIQLTISVVIITQINVDTSQLVDFIEFIPEVGTFPYYQNIITVIFSIIGFIEGIFLVIYSFTYERGKLKTWIIGRPNNTKKDRIVMLFSILFALLIIVSLELRHYYVFNIPAQEIMNVMFSFASIIWIIIYLLKLRKVKVKLTKKTEEVHKEINLITESESQASHHEHKSLQVRVNETQYSQRGGYGWLSCYIGAKNQIQGKKSTYEYREGVWGPNSQVQFKIGTKITPGTFVGIIKTYKTFDPIPPFFQSFKRIARLYKMNRQDQPKYNFIIKYDDSINPDDLTITFTNYSADASLTLVIGTITKQKVPIRCFGSWWYSEARKIPGNCVEINLFNSDR